MRTSVCRVLSTGGRHHGRPAAAAPPCVLGRRHLTLQSLSEENKRLKKKMQEVIVDLQMLRAGKDDLLSQLEEVKHGRLLQDSVDFVASKEITPLNLVDLVEYCRAEDYKTHLFLHRELPIRTAIAIQQLSSLPHGFVTMPSTRRVKQWLVEEFQQLTQAERPDTPEREHEFTQLLKKLHRRYQESIVTLGKGLYELKKDMLDTKVKVKDKKQEWEKINDLFVIEYPELQEALDMYYAGRISAGFLIRQHISMAAAKNRPPRKGSEDYIGLVCRKTDIYTVCEAAIEEAEAICDQQYGSHPEIVLVRKHTGAFVQIPHIPAHLHYILFELLKNSLRATVETHGTEGHRYNCSETPPIEVTICDSEGLEDVSVRVSDQGGGIKQANMDKVMSYMYTTAKVSQFEVMIEGQSKNTGSRTPLAGFGYGLPISRLYAQHFDGDLRLVSVEGYGTDAYLHLGRSLQSTFETSLRNKRRTQSSMRSRLFTSIDEPTYT